MILLIAFPFIALVVFILLMRLRRGFQEVEAMRARRTALMLPEDHRRPSDDFHDQTWLPLCQSIASDASGKSNRPLTLDEWRTVWRTRSQLILEVAVNEIRAASNSEEVSTLLHTLPPGMNRPDPTAWCESS
jgi:hypothetical protein